MIFIPQLEVLKKLKGSSQFKHILSSLPLTKKCLDSEDKETKLSQGILSLDGNCLLVEVNAPVDSFLFPRNKKICNNEIKKKYALINNLYFQIEKEYEGLIKVLGEYNSKIEKIFEEIKEKLKKKLIRVGIRVGISLSLAAVTGGLSLGVDALLGYEGIGESIEIATEIYDLTDVMDTINDSMDISDILDANIISVP